MWAALKSDFSEVISGIKDEGSTAINIVAKPRDEYGVGNVEKEDFFEEQDVVLDDGMVFHHAKDGESTFEQTGIVSSPADEISLLRDSEETFLHPLVPWEVNGKDPSKDCSGDETQQLVQPSDDTDAVVDDDAYVDEKLFLEQFKINDTTEEIASVLKKYPNTVEIHFNSLVPEVVTYTQFWQRYFYRCNLTRVEKRWQDEADMRERERKEMIQKGVERVTNLFGGAMKNIGRVVAPKTEEENESTYEKYQKQLKEQNQILSHSNETPSAPPFSIFGSSGRPPFVMDTADSSDEEGGIDAVKKVIEETEVEEEEEELGWDSDEEDYEEDDEDSQMIEFQSPGNSIPSRNSWKFENEKYSQELDKLREQLETVLEERNSLQQTIEMQTKELTEANLMKKSSCLSDPNDLENQVQKLEMQVFERNSELAALKASLDDDAHDENKLSQKFHTLTDRQKEIENMKTTIISRDDKIVKLLEDVEKQSNELKTVSAELALCKEEFISTKSKLFEAEQQRDELSKTLQSEKNHFSLEQTKMQEKQASKEQTISELRSLLESSNEKNVEFEKNLDEMRKQMKLSMKKSMEKLAREDAANDIVNETNSGSTGSSSAVHVPMESDIAKISNDDDDWGDDW